MVINIHTFKHIILFILFEFLSILVMNFVNVITFTKPIGI